MREFKKYVYKNLDYIDDMLVENYKSEYLLHDMKMLGLYYRDIFQYKPKIREDLITEFCMGQVDNFTHRKYYKLIDSAMNYSRNKNNILIQIDKVDIYNSEFEYINELDIPNDYKKLMLAFLVKNKITREIMKIKGKDDFSSIFFGGGERQYREVKNMANISSKYKIHDDIIHDLSKMGLIEILHSGSIKLLFLDNCFDNDVVLLEIKDYNHVGWYLDMLNGDLKIKQCSECDVLIKDMTRNNNRLYCDDCKLEINKNHARKSMKNLRSGRGMLSS